MLNSLLSTPTQIRRADNAADLADLRRQALSVAVLARLHIAYQQYLAAVEGVSRATDEAASIAGSSSRSPTAPRPTAQSELERVSAQVNTVYSELRRYQAYSEMQAALGRIYAALGLDPVPNEAVSDIAELSKQIRIRASDWQGGSFPITSVEPPPKQSEKRQVARQSEVVVSAAMEPNIHSVEH